MTDKKKNNMVVEARKFFFYISIWVLAFHFGCQMPASCGPGDIPTNPLSSNLIDFTDPPSGSILHHSEMLDLEVVFLRPVVKDTFSSSDDLRVFRIEGFWDPPYQETQVFPGPSAITELWPDESCDSDGNCHRLKLSIVKNAFSPDYHYRIRFLGEEPANPNDPDPDPPDSLLLSKEGEPLRKDVDIYIRVVPDNPQDAERPYVSDEEPVQLTWNCVPASPFYPMCYIPPHQVFRFKFSEPMAFIYFIPDPLWGFNFTIIDELSSQGNPRSVLTSSSIQGLDPGTFYNLNISSLVPAPSKGFPPSIDRSGNLLRESKEYVFETSHVRIAFPLRLDPLSEEPTNWVEQVEDLGIEYNFAVVEVTDSVARISARLPTNGYPDIVFEDEDVTGKDVATITELEFDECTPSPYDFYIFRDQNLYVAAYDEGGTFLGSDFFEVDPFPPDYKITSFPEYYDYLGNYPENLARNWTDNIQGVTHDENYWYITNESEILKIPVTTDLTEEIFYTRRIGIGDLDLPPGYNHFGDITHRLDPVTGVGYVFIPVEGSDPPLIAAMESNPDDLDTFELVAYNFLPQGSAGWCAIDSEGYLYTSDGGIAPDSPMLRYVIDWSALRNGAAFLSPSVEDHEIHLWWDKNHTSPLTLKSMQGGVFSENDHLYLVNGYCNDFDPDEGGIWVINKNGWYEVDHSEIDAEHFKFEFHPDPDPSMFCVEDEPEGITIWNFDKPGFFVPGMSGQIHVLMIDNNAGWDGLYFKHYTTNGGDRCKI